MIVSVYEVRWFEPGATFSQNGNKISVRVGAKWDERPLRLKSMLENELVAE